MKCSHCGHDNLQGRKFCIECAAPLPVICLSCGVVNEPGAKFCGECSQLLSSPAAPISAPAPKSAPAPTAPSAFVGGRYQVKKFLGEGGKKKVYLALDELLDREVAFALIKTEGLDETARVRIRREAQAMGRLGSHPHIVTVFDLGEEDGQPYMVTEFMGGGDVEHLIKKAENHRLPIDRCLEITRQIGMGLQFAHARGIVHRDLKPGNVWLTNDGIAKIGDFGLALSLDRSRLTSEGMMVGTVSYMPPEQALGSDVTPQADLYSLGAMFYEMITGRPPFLGDDPVAIISQHINTPPVAPSWHNPHCPRNLEALILRLLAKDPAERPANAGDVLTALGSIDVKAIDERPLEETRSLDSLAGGVFVGRQKEMSELKAALEEALSGHGRLMMLVGEPGIGKTRTALELTTYAGLRKAQVLWGRCYESQGTPPYWPWVQAIRAYVRDATPPQLLRVMGAGAANIAEIVSDVRQCLPDLEPPLAIESPEAARFRLFDSIAAFLKSASGAHPLVVILDDLQWADKLTLLLLQFVVGELAASHLLILGTYRDVELSRKHPLAQALGELTRERAFQRVLLRGLSQPDVRRFIELTSGLEPPDALVKAVHNQTEGNPLFVNEVVRLLVQEGELDPSRLKERTSWSVRIPEGVREVIGRRLDRLSERCNQALAIASIIGREFSFVHLAKLVEGVSEDKLVEALEEAIAARVIEELPRPQGRYQFTHALIQETLAEELSGARRVRQHARIAQMLEAFFGAQAEEHAAELAFHYSEAEPVLGTEKMVHYALAAGELALAGYAYEDALAHFQRGVMAKMGQPMDEQTATMLFGMGRAEGYLSLWDESATHLGQAFDYYAEVGDVQHSTAVASVGIFSFRFETLMTPLVERALKLVPPESVAAGWLLCAEGLAVAQIPGDYEGGKVLLQRAIAIAKTTGTPKLELRALATWTNAAMGSLRLQDLDEANDRALDLLTSLESPRDEANSRSRAVLRFTWKGEMRKASIQAKAAMAAAERLRDRGLLCFVGCQGQILAQYGGNWAEARVLSKRMLTVSPDYPEALAQALFLECQLGKLEQAESYWERLMENAQRTEYLWVIFGGWTWSAESARITGNRRWLDIVRDSASRSLASSNIQPLRSSLLRIALGLVAAEDENTAQAAEQYAHLDQLIGSGFASLFYRHLGIIARAASLEDKAQVHYEDALTFTRQAGYRPEIAWTCCDYADLLRERKRPGDGEKTEALLEEGLTIARDLGMRPLMERILSRRQFLKA